MYNLALEFAFTWMDRNNGINKKVPEREKIK